MIGCLRTQSLHFILSLRLYSSFITPWPAGIPRFVQIKKSKKSNGSGVYFEKLCAHWAYKVKYGKQVLSKIVTCSTRSY